ncbi:MAG: hypothetical protein GF320_02920 [Armatimonadia bacterium]|nr:hypothetical protein [Armatimonadia bacterium]
MDPFPAVDPIPLPAPVWLFKVLHLFTLSLHFTAVHLLIGGLVLGTIWAIAAWRGGDDSPLREPARQVMRRLPVVMAFVINLGVPPLLFTQVLYGRALYTSSILIGVFWIGVIVLMVVLYSLLYSVERRSAEGKAYWWAGLISIGIVAKIALIYVNNMTLMLRPDTWLEMYRGNALGGQLAMDDPTVWPRWLYMITASLMLGGIAIALTGATAVQDRRAGAYLKQWGALVGAIAAGALVPVAIWVLMAQPAAVGRGLGESAFYNVTRAAWLLLTFGVALVAGYASWRGSETGWKLTGAAALLGYLQVAAWVVLRDGIRDKSLEAYGFSVWAREISVNWSVVGLFLVLLVGGLVAVGWLLKVMLQAEGEYEGYVGGEELPGSDAA